RRSRGCRQRPAAKRCRQPWSGVSLVLFFQLFANPLALQRAEIVDEQFAVEMIDLVLDAHRQQSLGLDLEWLSFPVERPHPDPLGPPDGFVEARYRQAALVVFAQMFRVENLD